MRGECSLRPQILRGGDDASAEEELPVTVDGHAGGERMPGVGQPAGQPETALRRILGKGEQRFRGLDTHRTVLRRIVRAPGKNVCRPRLRQLLHRHDLENLRLGRKEPLAPLPQLFTGFCHLGIDGREIVRPQEGFVLTEQCLGQASAVVKLGNLDVCQSAVENPQFIEEAVLQPGRAKAGAEGWPGDAIEIGQAGTARLRVLVKVVANDFRFHPVAVDKDVLAGCFSRAIMAHRDVYPFSGR